jgi:hypothetical protein
MYFVPAFLAANLQSWRKYVEHMGLTGPAPLGVTRSVVAPGWAGRAVAFSLFNEPFHGVHHLYAGLPQGVLPELAPALTPSAEGELSPFPSYRSALGDMLRTLVDPRVGEQWVKSLPSQAENGTSASC